MLGISLNDWVGISQIISAVALIASLIFVGIQIRNNTTNARAGTLQANLMFWQDFFSMMVDPETGRTYSRGAAGKTDLTGAEFGQFFFQCRIIFMGCENQHYQFTQGLIDPDAYRGYETTIREQIATQAGVRAMWSLQRQSYGTAFKKFFEEQIVKAAQLEDHSTHDMWKNALPRAPPTP